MNWFRDFLLPKSAAANTGDVDGLFMFIAWLIKAAF